MHRKRQASVAVQFRRQPEPNSVGFCGLIAFWQRPQQHAQLTDMLHQLRLGSSRIGAVKRDDVRIKEPHAFDPQHARIASGKTHSDLVFRIQLLFEVLDVQDHAFISPLCRALLRDRFFQTLGQILNDGLCARVGMHLARTGPRMDGASVYDHLYESARVKQKKVDDLKKRIEAERARDCTFKPHTNPRRAGDVTASRVGAAGGRRPGAAVPSHQLVSEYASELDGGEEPETGDDGDLLNALQAQLRSLKAEDQKDPKALREAWEK